MLTTGALEAAVRARAAGYALETPHLAIAYQARDFRGVRELGESWKILTEEAKEPVGFAERHLRR